MALAAASANQSAASGLWAQIQQQQAQRTADQAEQNARSLRAKAQDAQSVAERAQENARSLKVQSNQADGESSQARLNLAMQAEGGEVQARLSDLHDQINQVLASNLTASATTNSVPVINSLGQTTGSLVNVTA